MRKHRPSHTFSTTPPRRPSSVPLGRPSESSRVTVSSNRYDPIAMEDGKDFSSNIPSHLKKWAATPPPSTPSSALPSLNNTSSNNSAANSTISNSAANLSGLPELVSRISSDHGPPTSTTSGNASGNSGGVGIDGRSTSPGVKPQSAAQDSSYSSFALLAAAAAASSSASPVGARGRGGALAVDADGLGEQQSPPRNEKKVGRNHRKHQHGLRQRRKLIGLRQQEEHDPQHEDDHDIDNDYDEGVEDDEGDNNDDEYDDVAYEEEGVEEGKVRRDEDEEEKVVVEKSLAQERQKQFQSTPRSYSPPLSHPPSNPNNHATARRHHSLHYTPTPRGLTRLRSLRDRDRHRSRSSHSHSDNHLPLSIRSDTLLSRARRVFTLPTSAKHRRSTYPHHYQRQQTLQHVPQRSVSIDQQTEEEKEHQRTRGGREQSLPNARGRRLFTMNDVQVFDTDHSTFLQSNSHSLSPSLSPSPLRENLSASTAVPTEVAGAVPAASSTKRRGQGVFGGRASPTVSYTSDEDGVVKHGTATSLLGRAGRKVGRPFSPRNLSPSQVPPVSNSTFAYSPNTSTNTTPTKNMNSDTNCTPTTNPAASGIHPTAGNPNSTSGTNANSDSRLPSSNFANAPVNTEIATANGGHDALHMRIRVLENELEASRIRHARQRRRIQQLEEESTISRQALPSLEAIIKSALAHFDAKEAALKHTIANMHREMGIVVAEKNEAMRLLASFVGRTTRSPPASFSSSLSEAAFEVPLTRERRGTLSAVATTTAQVNANPVGVERERDFAMSDLERENHHNHSQPVLQSNSDLPSQAQ